MPPLKLMDKKKQLPLLLHCCLFNYVVDFDFFFMCECAVGIDVRDRPTTCLFSILPIVVVGCIVLGRQMNVDFAMIVCKIPSPVLEWMCVFVP